MQALFLGSLLRNNGEGHRGQHADEGGDVIPAHLFLKIKQREPAKYQQRDDFLDDFQLRGRVNIAAPTVGRHLEAIFEKCDAPTRDDDEPERFEFVFQMPVPRECHEEVRAKKQDNRQPAGVGEGVHKFYSEASVSPSALRAP
jgi:hypothetical protein